MAPSEAAMEAAVGSSFHRRAVAPLSSPLPVAPFMQKGILRRKSTEQRNLQLQTQQLGGPPPTPTAVGTAGRHGVFRDCSLKITARLVVGQNRKNFFLKELHNWVAEKE